MFALFMHDAPVLKSRTERLIVIIYHIQSYIGKDLCNLCLIVYTPTVVGV